MENTLSVAKALYDMYNTQYHESMDEMKMHKLMYFAQRESLMYNKNVLFDEDFYGWKYGPVLKSIRSEYMNHPPFDDVQPSVTAATKSLLHSVLDRYGSASSWKLSCLSHEELSWKKARKELKASDNGNVRLSLNAMKLDAIHELASRKQEAGKRRGL